MAGEIFTPEQLAALKKKLGIQDNGGQAYPTAQPPGSMGFGDVMNDPEKNKAAADAAGTLDDGTSLGLMELGNNSNLAARGGGVMSPFEAAANGLKQGIGTYSLMSGVKNKQNLISSMLRKKKPGDLGGELPSDAEGVPMSASGEYGFGD